MAKFKNKKVKTEDGTFDSKFEYSRWVELKAMEKAGLIEDLRRQVSYTLIGTQKGELRTERPVKYNADFVYYENGKLVVEDTKSKATKTPEYIIKRKLMKFIHGIEVKEVCIDGQKKKKNILKRTTGIRQTKK